MDTFLTMKFPRLISLLLAATAISLPVCQGQIENKILDFASPPVWGAGTFQMFWGADPQSIKFRGDDGMSDKSGQNFAVLDASLWKPNGDIPYLRSIVSRVMWPIGTITAQDEGKMVKFSALFGWYGGESMRAKDMAIGRASGFAIGDGSQGFAGLDDGPEFEFESVSEKDWGEISSTYTIKPEDVGKELCVGITVLCKQEIADGLPVLATSDWKVTVKD
jgi:hypothetical protein